MATRKEIKAVMKQAAKYRKEGMSNHEALVKAWEGHKKSSETDFVNSSGVQSQNNSFETDAHSASQKHSGSRKGKRERRHHK
jgi:hypothetical protein